MATLSGTLPKGYESREMFLTVSRRYPRRYWELRLSAHGYSIPAEIDGRPARNFKTRRAAIESAAAGGLVASPIHWRDGVQLFKPGTSSVVCKAREG